MIVNLVLQPGVRDDVRQQAGLATATEVLVAVYPTTVSGLPASLKGWFERVLVPGVGFVFDERGKVRPGLANIRHIVGVATYAESRWTVAARNDNGRRTLTRALRMSCGWQARTHWLGLYSVGAVPGARTGREFGERVERRMADLS